jgi:hypothetical protein
MRGGKVCGGRREKRKVVWCTALGLKFKSCRNKRKSSLRKNYLLLLVSNFL